MLLETTRENPSVRASRLGVDGVAGAGNRARAERQRIGFVRRGRQPRVVAAQRRGVRQEEMRDQHRLRAAQVRVRRHQRRTRLLRLIGARRHDFHDRLLQQAGMRRRR